MVKLGISRCSRIEQATAALGQGAVRRRREAVELDTVSDRQLDDAGSRACRLTCNGLLFTRLLLSRANALFAWQPESG
jgi:hypothetical protein